jgi:hypothetical protein
MSVNEAKTNDMEAGPGTNAQVFPSQDDSKVTLPDEAAAGKTEIDPAFQMKL